MNLQVLLKIISRVNGVLKHLLCVLCAVLMTALTLVVLWGVLTRYIFGEQPAFTEEFARMFLICVTFIGGALAFAEGSHIGLDYLAAKFTPPARRLCALVAFALSAFFVVLVLLYGGSLFISTSYKSANLLVSAQVYLWQIYLCIPLSGVFSLMFLSESVLSVICQKADFAPEKLSDEGGSL